MKTIAIIGTLDTKGYENKYLKERIEKSGAAALVINIGPMGEPVFAPDVSAEDVAKAAGSDLKDIREKKDRSFAIEKMSIGSTKIVERLYSEGKIQGIIAMGGSQGTTMGAAAMRTLPIGFPKVLVSTIATSEHQQKIFEGIKDTMVISSLVDISGLNHIMRMILNKAVASVIAMANITLEDTSESKITIALTMYGITTPCVSRVREILESKGYEVLVFHASGMGGRLMEQLIRQGAVQGVADITLGEISHEVVGGIGSAGANRLEAAGEMGIPQIIVIGAVDVINFIPESIPERFKDRLFLMHNPQLKVMRTSVDENQMIGKMIAEKLNRAKGKTTVLFPLKGVSAYDSEGGAFYDPDADFAVFDAVRKNINPNIQLLELNKHINDNDFAEKIAELMIVSMHANNSAS
jgi:uncharacterized protein (UPF0261 family)